MSDTQETEPVEVDQSVTDAIWADFRNAINMVAKARGEWAGYPIPIPRSALVLEPRYPFPALETLTMDDEESETEKEQRKEAIPVPRQFKIRNVWWSFEKNGWVYILEDDGIVRWATRHEGLPRYRLDMSLNTLGVAVSPAWTLEAEARAQTKLKDLITARAYKSYMLSGQFLETSPKSHVTYLFRRSRPTVALNRQMKILACLCMHPIGYYAGTWGGVMVPTDCVIAHLMLMRADEHWFWKKSNQHPPYIPEAGL